MGWLLAGRGYLAGLILKQQIWDGWRSKSPVKINKWMNCLWIKMGPFCSIQSVSLLGFLLYISQPAPSCNAPLLPSPESCKLKAQKKKNLSGPEQASAAESQKALKLRTDCAKHQLWPHWLWSHCNSLAKITDIVLQLKKPLPHCRTPHQLVTPLVTSCISFLQSVQDLGCAEPELHWVHILSSLK